MGRQLFPTTDLGLLSWSQVLSSHISASPGAFGLTTELADRYAAKHAAFAAAMEQCQPSTRTRMAVSIKNEAREALKAMGRRLVSLINGTESVTAAQKIGLGLNVRGTATPVSRPERAPRLVVASVSAWTVKLRLDDPAVSGRRGKPVGVSGASLFSFVGDVVPVDLADWRFEGNAGRVGLDLTFGSGNRPGTRVWLAAFWFNDRKQGGPPCAPVSTFLQGGAVAMAA